MYTDKVSFLTYQMLAKIFSLVYCDNLQITALNYSVSLQTSKDANYFVGRVNVSPTPESVL